MSAGAAAGGAVEEVRAELPRGSRYELLERIASGGMATVYVGRLLGAQGFRRLVAIKRAHAHLVEDDSFRRMLEAEAHVASRLHHPNVVAVQDVEVLAGELLLVMDYVEGAALNVLIAASARGEVPLPAAVAVRSVLDCCAGLEAVHCLTDEDGRPLGLIHRDVSPQNILVGVDGVSRIADFGVAKFDREGSRSLEGLTTTGALKGKLGYMAPEYVEGAEVDQRADVFALGVVAWEALAGRRLFKGDNELDTLRRVAAAVVPKLSSVVVDLGPVFDDVLARALAKSPGERWPDARSFGVALETAARANGLLASHAEVGAHVAAVAQDELHARRERIRARGEARPAIGRPRPTTRRPALAKLVGGALVAALVAAGGLALHGRSARTGRDTAAPPAPAETIAASSASAAPPSSRAGEVAPALPSSASAPSATEAAPPPSASARRHRAARAAAPASSATKTTDDDRPPPNPY